MRKVLSVFLSVMLLGSIFVIVGEAYCVDVQRVEQAETNWCWAACAEMLAKSQVNTNLTQSDAVAYIKGSASDNSTATIIELKNAAQYLSNNEVSYIRGATLTREATCRKLQSQYPIVCEITIQGNSANHAVIIHKVSCNDYHYDTGYLRLYIYDPGQIWDSEYEYSYEFMYEELINGVNGYPYFKTMQWINYVSVSGFASGV